MWLCLQIRKNSKIDHAFAWRPYPGLPWRMPATFSAFHIIVEAAEITGLPVSSSRACSAPRWACRRRSGRSPRPAHNQLGGDRLGALAIGGEFDALAGPSCTPIAADAIELGSRVECEPSIDLRVLVFYSYIVQCTCRSTQVKRADKLGIYASTIA